ncbi:MAG: nuclear transport factor 2 family protein [Candidatus Binataceae bacterium]
MEAIGMTLEEQLIKRYFDAFNRHDVEGVVACFHDEAVLVGPNGKRLVGIAEVRRSYETEFALFPDAHCDLRVCTGNSGRGVAESYFTGTRSEQRRVEAIGAEVMEMVDGKIKEIRDYHQPVPTKAAQEASVPSRKSQ